MHPWIGAALLAAGTLIPASMHAQSRWIGSVQGGYSVSTGTVESFPSGGSFGSSAFIGRQLSPLLALGGEAGFYGVENTISAYPSDCPLAPPGSLDCLRTDQAELDWIQLGVTLRAGKNDGSWRPYGAVGLGVYFGRRDTETSIVFPNTGEIVLPAESESIDRTALGGSIGAGLDWVPSQSQWSLGVSMRLHYLVGGDENGEFGGDTFVTLLAGVGYRW